MTPPDAVTAEVRAIRDVQLASHVWPAQPTAGRPAMSRLKAIAFESSEGQLQKLVLYSVSRAAFQLFRCLSLIWCECQNKSPCDGQDLANATL